MILFTIADISLLLPYSATQIFAAPLLAKLDSAKILSLSLCATSLAILACSCSDGSLLLCLFLAASGAAQAPIWPAAAKLVMQSTDKDGKYYHRCASSQFPGGGCHYILLRGVNRFSRGWGVPNKVLILASM